MENRSFMENPNFGFKENDFNTREQPPVPNSYLALSIIGTVIGGLGGLYSCFIGMILGIIALVFSTQVSSKYSRGDYYGAQQASKTAKILGIISVVIGILGSAFIVAFIIFAALSQNR